MKRTNFTIIGGASAYVPGLVQALTLNASALNLDKVTLYDIDEQRLEIVAKLCARLAETNNAGFHVAAETSLADALVGTDIVLNSSRPGGLECRRIDETLPLSFGIPGQETVGPGGFFFALRSIPEALKLASEMAKSAPRATLLNYTNPSNIVTQALVDSGFESVVGLCDQAYEDLEALAASMQAELEPLKFDCLGLNHASVYSSISFGGTAVNSIPMNLIPPNDLDQDHQLRFEVSARWAKEHPGMWPNSYLAYYFSPDDFVRLAKTHGPRTDVILQSIPKYYEHFQQELKKNTPHLRLFRGSTGFGDLAVHVLKALREETPVGLVLNLKNNETCEIFAEDSVIEVSAVVRESNTEKQPPSAPVPEDILPLLRRLENYQRATAQAAINPSTARLIEALSENPLVPSKEVAAKMIESAAHHYGSSIEFFNEN